MALIDWLIVCSVAELNGVLNRNVDEVADNDFELCSFEYLAEPSLALAREGSTEAAVGSGSRNLNAI